MKCYPRPFLRALPRPSRLCVKISPIFSVYSVCSVGTPSDPMKKPTKDERRHACTRKRRYRTQGEALDAAAILGLERQRTAYRCALCQQWHLASN